MKKLMKHVGLLDQVMHCSPVFAGFKVENGAFLATMPCDPCWMLSSRRSTRIRDARIDCEQGRILFIRTIYLTPT
jgi:hypothetical protein